MSEEQEPQTTDVAITADVFDGQLWVRADSLAAKLLAMADVYDGTGWELLTYGGITPGSVCRELGTQFAELAEAVTR